MIWARRFFAIVGTLMAYPIPSSATTPTAEQISTAVGESLSAVLGVHRLSLQETGREVYVVDAILSTGVIRSFTVDGAGQVAEPLQVLTKAEAMAKRQRYGGVGPQLSEHLKGRKSTELVPVAIWTKVKVDYPQRRALLANPTSLAADQLTVQSQLSSAMDPIVRWLNSHASVVTNALKSGDTTSPLLRAQVPASLIPALASLANVDVVELDSPTRHLSTAWYETTKVPTARAITTAAGVRACVVGDDRPDDTTYLRVAGLQNPDGPITDDHHSKLVMGVMSNTFGPGITDAQLWMGNYAYSSRITGINWCRDQQAAVMNFSTGEVPYAGLMDRQLDWYSLIWPWPLMVAGSGNSQIRQGVCENCGKNSLVVGASDDQRTTAIADDTIADFSSWINPPATYGDYELPHLVAPGVNVTSVPEPNPLNDSTGTSFATPQVAGAGMLMVAHNPILSGWPEAMKAIIMASAVANIDGDRFSSLPASSDMKDGVGLLDTAAAVELAGMENWVDPDNSPRAKGFHAGWFKFGVGSYPDPWRLVASRDGRMRVVLSWNSFPTCNDDGTNCISNELAADFNLYVYDVSVPGILPEVCSSDSFDSSWEGCEFEVRAGNKYLIRVGHRSAYFDNAYVGIAWTDIPIPEKPTAQVTVLSAGRETFEDEGIIYNAIHATWQTSPGAEGVMLMMTADPGAILPPLVDGQAAPCHRTGGNWNYLPGIGDSGWKCIDRRASTGGFVRVYNVSPTGMYRIMAVPFNEYRLGMPSYLINRTANNPVTVYASPGTPVPALSRPVFALLVVVMLALGSLQSRRAGGRRGCGLALVLALLGSSLGCGQKTQGVRLAADSGVVGLAGPIVDAGGYVDVGLDDSRREAEVTSFNAAAKDDVVLSPCLTNVDCEIDSFCFYFDDQVARCPGDTRGRRVLSTPGVCRRIPCGSAGCLGRACVSNQDCNPEERCERPTNVCGPAEVHLEFVECDTDCSRVLSETRSFFLCLCPVC